jgi:hypothetical protein
VAEGQHSGQHPGMFTRLVATKGVKKSKQGRGEHSLPIDALDVGDIVLFSGA